MPAWVSTRSPSCSRSETTSKKARKAAQSRDAIAAFGSKIRVRASWEFRGDPWTWVEGWNRVMVPSRNCLPWLHQLQASHPAAGNGFPHLPRPRWGIRRIPSSKQRPLGHLFRDSWIIMCKYAAPCILLDSPPGPLEYLCSATPDIESKQNLATTMGLLALYPCATQKKISRAS